MALTKQPVTINFSKGVDTKTDQKQVQLGKFLALQNSVFDTAGRLTKRNGFGSITALPNTSSTFLTTYNNNLTAVGSSLYAYASGQGSWVNRGSFQPAQLSTLPLVRVNTSQSQSDTAVASNGTVCTVYTDNVGGSPVYKYTIADSTTGQVLVSPTVIPQSPVSSCRVFVLGLYFVILVPNSSSLKYVALSTLNLSATPITGSINTTFSAIAPVTGLPASSNCYDGVVSNGNLYVAWNANDGTVKVAYLTSTLVSSSALSLGSYQAENITLSADSTNTLPNIYIGWSRTSGSGPYTCVAYVAAISANLVSVLAPTQVYTATDAGGGSYYFVGQILNVGLTAQSGTAHFIYEAVTVATTNNLDYPHDNILRTRPITQAGSLGTDVVVMRGMGMASKGFIVGTTSYVLSTFGNSDQPTYFLLTLGGTIVAKLAYSNGGGYVKTGLPSVNVSGSTALVSYLFKDLISAVNKSQGVANTAGVYAQTGINLASFKIGTSRLSSVETAGDLHVTGGQLWMYDGNAPVEHGFHLYPSPPTNSVTTQSNFSTMTNGNYYYVATYEWSDNQGNVFRSAPSIPINVALGTGSGFPTATTTFTGGATLGSANVSTSAIVNGPLQVGETITSATAFPSPGAVITSVTGTTSIRTLPFSSASVSETMSVRSGWQVSIKVPTLRATAKISNPVKIVLYRWSVAQQTYYQVTSLTNPLLNDTTVDYVTFIDTQGDADIVGNSILYTTGGVIENIGAPAVSALTLHQSRLFAIDAEDPNLVWYSKEIVESTPVEMSDLLTLYIPPTTSAQGSTGNLKCLSSMDDKLILFKPNAIYYVSGRGPDNTGANSQYGDPTIVTGTVGCSNPQSIVFVPNGILFQSDKGIWLLGRDLSTSYIGAPVEAYNQDQVLSAVNVPGTNQVRFSLASGTTLMYDYYFNEWATFSNVPAIASTLYQGKHTFLDARGGVYQETPGLYLDGTKPVLMSFTTSWINIAGLQGYERAYFFYLLGQYISPHTLAISLAYDYEAYPSQVTTISPDNATAYYGGDSLYGGSSVYGGSGQNEQYRVFLQKQKCQAFQISVQEAYDPSKGIAPGAGFTLSGINALVGVKAGSPKVRASRSVG